MTRRDEERMGEDMKTRAEGRGTWRRLFCRKRCKTCMGWGDKEEREG